MGKGRNVRALIAAGALVLTGVPGASSAQGTLDDVEFRQSFVAAFDLTEPLRRVVVTGTTRIDAGLLFFPPNQPFPSQSTTSTGCVSIYRGPNLPLRDRACGEWTMRADPTLSLGTFAGRLPSDEGTMTVALTFIGTEQISEPQPIIVQPPFASVDLDLLRVANVAGIVTTDQGEGFDTPQTTTGVLAQGLNIQAYVFV